MTGEAAHRDGGTTSSAPPAPPSDRLEFAAELGRLKAASSYSYQALATAIERPVSTVHGWCSGKHLPYPRDNGVFEQLLDLLGVDDRAGWMHTLAELRRTAGRADTGVNPYRGLEPFTEQDADDFFGRTALTDRIVELVDERLGAARAGTSAETPPHLIAVVGASGSGKTSLLRAGVMPRLTRCDVAVSYLTPDDDDPLDHLTRVARDLRNAATGRSPEHRLVVLDRIEVLLGAAHRASLDDIAGVIDDLRRLPDTAVVIGLRADFFHRAASVRILLDALQHDPVVVGPMTFEEATDCIVRPAERVGITVSPDLVVELIDEFARHVDGRNATEALPLLSHVLYQLAERTTDRHLTVALYRRIGGLPHALERSADEAYRSLDESEQLACRALFLHLVELDPKALPTRRVLDRGDLARSDPDLDFDVVIDRFAERRLLIADIDSVAISHEALLTAWPLLATWIEDEHDALAVVRRISDATRTWLETDEDPHALAGGILLATAERLLTTASTWRLNDDERRFVRLSADAQAQRERRDAEVLSRQLSMQATVLRRADPPLSAQIALIAHETAPTVWTRSAVLSATSPLPGPRHLGNPGPTVVAVSADRKHLAVSDAATGSVRLYGRHGHYWHRDRTVTCCAPGSTPYAIALSPDGRLLAVGGTDRVPTLVDLALDDRSIRLGDVEFDGPVHGITFDPDGTHVTVVGTGSDIARWRVEAGPAARLDQTIRRPGTTMAVATDRQGNLAVARSDGAVELHHPDADGQLRQRWSDPGHPDVAASSVGLSPDGTVLVVGYHDGSVRAWHVDPSSATVTGAIEIGRSAEFASWVNRVSFDPSGRLLAAAASDGRVRTWDTRTWALVERELQHPTVVTDVRWVDDTELVTTAEDGTLRSWYLTLLAPNERGATIWSATYDAAGDRLVTCSPNFALVHDARGHRTERHHPASPVRTPQLMWRLTAPDELTLSGASAISPDGRLAVLGTRQGVVIVCRLPDHPAHPVADVLAVPAEELDTDRALHLDPLPGLVDNVCWSANGRAFAAVDSAGHARLWTLEGDGTEPVGVTARPDVRVPPPGLNVAVTPDGSHLGVVTESGTVHLFGVPDDPADALVPESVTRTGDSFATSLAFHPTLPVMAVSNADRSVTVWSIERPSAPHLIQRLAGPGGHPYWLCFSPVGDRLAAGSTDGRAWVWDVTALGDASGRGSADPIVEFARIESEGSGVYAVAISPCGANLIGVGPRGRIDRWIIDEELAVATLELACGDEVTPEEWASYVPTVPFRHATPRR